VRTVVTSIAYIAALLVRIPSYDVIHIFSASYYSFLLAPTPAILVAKLFGKRTILNYRSGEAEDHLANWRGTVAIVRMVDRVVVPSGYLVDVFARFGLPATPIFNFVHLDRFVYRERAPLKPVFLSNRNFEALYDVATTLRAFALIQARYPSARLTVAGEGPERQVLEALAGSLGLENTTFLGKVTPDTMPRLYNEADIYLNSPRIDNMPSSILEAFASGTPVASTNAGGIPYIVTHERTGLLVDCGDHEALAAEAIRLLENQLLATSIAQNAKRECERYRWESVRLNWLDLYHSLTGTVIRRAPAPGA
jgi:glycosyltransferase involved in cell wall biosynthesis